MNNSPWLILDCNYICYKSFFGFKNNINHLDLDSFLVYDFLSNIERMGRMYQTDKFIFCFDRGFNIRKYLEPTYKLKRKEQLEQQDEEEQKLIKAMKEQTNKIRDEILPHLKYKNIFHQEGFESDDMIAMAAAQLTKRNEDAIILTADKDLLQCISHCISFYSGQRNQLPITLQKFKETYGISPKLWAKVKAIAGCISDNVSGVAGVGEKTAIKFLKNQLPMTSKKYQDIIKSTDLIKHNLKLVKLPLKGTIIKQIETDNIEKIKRRTIRYANENEMPTLANNYMTTRRRKKL